MALCAGLLLWGSQAHLERYITPQRGIGYWLGITGGSMMALILVYSLRKRLPFMSWLGGVPRWFDVHMVMGIVGPILILFHANFSLGAINSNVALICMLLVAGSGIIGRYFYSRIHFQAHDQLQDFEQLKSFGDRWGLETGARGLIDVIAELEVELIEPRSGVVARQLDFLTGRFRVFIACWRLRREIAGSLAAQAGDLRIRNDAVRYARRRWNAKRRAQEYRTWVRLFSVWHMLHIPLFFMLLIAAIVHVVAINIY